MAAKALPPVDEGQLFYHQHQATTFGMLQDIKTLLEITVARFDENATLRIRNFTRVWKSMKFGLIFHGRQSYRELYEFTEDLFDVTKTFTMSNNKMGTRAAAFYLLYTLYFKQPLRPEVRIRVSYEDYEDLCQWMNECRRDRHWELVYCWAKLISSHAFYFVGSTKPVGMENAVVAEKRSSVAGNFARSGGQGLSGHEPFYKEEACRDMMDSIRKTHNRYTNMKKALSGDNTNDQGLSIVSEDFPDKFMELSNVTRQRTFSDNVEGNFLEEEGVTIGQRRKNILDRAYGGDDDDDELYESQGTGGEKSKSSRGRPVARLKKEPSPKIPDSSGDLRSIVRSLTAVKEDPSLMAFVLNETPSTSSLLVKKKGGKKSSPTKKKKQQKTKSPSAKKKRTTKTESGNSSSD